MRLAAVEFVSMSSKSLGVLIAPVILASCAVSAAESSGSSFEAFKKTMSVTAGPNALACGEVSLEANAAEAFKCARNAIDTNVTFWVVVQKQGVDSQLWVGAARDPQGVLYQVHFDSGVRGEFAAKPTPTFSISHCSSLKFDDEKHRILCVPSRR